MSLLRFRHRGDWLVAGFNVERLTDPVVVQQATRELADRFERLPLRGNAAITFDGVDRASSQLVGLLLAARAIVVDDRFGRLVLCRVESHLDEILRLARLSEHFERSPRLRDLLAESPRRVRSRTWGETVPPSAGRGETDWID